MKMTEYQRTLAEENMDLVELIVKKNIGITADPMLSFDDLYQVGCEALCKAAMKYEPKKSMFRTFASVVMRNALLDYCRQMNIRRRHMAACMTEGEVFDILEVTENAECTRMMDNVESLEAVELFQKKKTEYTGVARAGLEAMELRMYGYSVKEIAEMKNTSRDNVFAWISRARAKLVADHELITALV